MANTEEIKLYDGTEEIIFYPDSHRYRKPGQQTYLVSVSSVTNVISPWGKIDQLKQWAVNVGCDYIEEYLNEIIFGELDDEIQDKLKEVELKDIHEWQIAGEDKVKEGLEEVYNEGEVEEIYDLVKDQIAISIDNISVDEVVGLVKDARYRHKKDLEKEASLGDEVHAFAEEFARRKAEGEHMTDDMLEFDDDRALSLVNDFLDWVDEHGVEFLEAERVVYSRRRNYVGTMDLLARIDGDVYVVDYKTSSGIFEGHKIQVAGGYLPAWNEEATYTDNVSGVAGNAMVVRFDKDGGGFETWSADDTDIFKRMFNNGLQIKKDLKELNRK